MLVPIPAIFVVIATSNPEAVQGAIEQQYPGDFYKLGQNTWVIVAPSTSKEVSDRLGISDNSNGLGVVMRASTYYGREYQQLWEWLAAKSGTMHAA